jgi:hypothetical protein
MKTRRLLHSAIALLAGLLIASSVHTAHAQQPKSESADLSTSVSSMISNSRSWFRLG